MEHVHVVSLNCVEFMSRDDLLCTITWDKRMFRIHYEDLDNDKVTVKQYVLPLRKVI